MQTIIIFSHTFWQDSKVNKALLESAQKLANVKIHNLTTAYPSGAIDVGAEIALLKNADKIIFQFPLFWFSTPSVMKEWQDRVLTAILYGSEPKLLQGKRFQIITTAGGAESSYDGHHGYSIDTLLSPINHAFTYSGCEIEKAQCIFSANASNLPIDEYLANIKG